MKKFLLLLVAILFITTSFSIASAQTRKSSSPRGGYNYLRQKHRAANKDRYHRKRMEYILRYKINKPHKRPARTTKSKARYRSFRIRKIR